MDRRPLTIELTSLTNVNASNLANGRSSMVDRQWSNQSSNRQWSIVNGQNINKTSIVNPNRFICF
jgi:hypothetical protein